ncbi:MAG: lyase domain protein repeat-containing protein, partial [Verrucomicrobiales bacterium]|nr:lyase domain protein repeat-containing protein [Verrucomicrobiales bacterium]
MKKKSIVLTIVGAAILIGILAFFNSARQSVKQRQPFEYWLSQVYTTNQSKALAAIRQMGPEKFPFFITALKKRDSPLDTWWQKTYPKLPRSAQAYFSIPVPASSVSSAASLALLNCDTKAIIPELSEMLRIPNSEVRAAALIAMLRNISKDHPKSVPPLMIALTDTNRYVRYRAASCLEKIGPAANPAVPQLTELLKDDSDVVRLFSAKALTSINHDTNACAVLKQLLGSTQSINQMQTAQYIRHWAAVYLNKIEPDAEKTVPVFMASLQDPDRTLRVSAAHSLESLGPEAKPAIPV